MGNGGRKLARAEAGPCYKARAFGFVLSHVSNIVPWSPGSRLGLPSYARYAGSIRMLPLVPQAYAWGYHLPPATRALLRRSTFQRPPNSEFLHGF
jgi:hypothetical protein